MTALEYDMTSYDPCLSLSTTYTGIVFFHLRVAARVFPPGPDFFLVFYFGGSRGWKAWFESRKPGEKSDGRARLMAAASSNGSGDGQKRGGGGKERRNNQIKATMAVAVGGSGNNSHRHSTAEIYDGV